VPPEASSVAVVVVSEETEKVATSMEVIGRLSGLVAAAEVDGSLVRTNRTLTPYPKTKMRLSVSRNPSEAVAVD